MIKIIPAIDIIDGRCVRLSQGDYQKKTVYHDQPLEVAKSFEDAGIEHLHLVDLDGARAQHIVNWKVLETIARYTRLSIDFGGGLKSAEDVDIALNAGASQITCGSIAVKAPKVMQAWIGKYGGDKIILGADAKDRKIAISGWLEDAGLDLFSFVKGYLDKGIQYVTCTDIATDGMLSGPNMNLYQEMLTEMPQMKLIASGGVASISDIRALNDLGVHGVIIGKALYEGKINLKELAQGNS